MTGSLLTYDESSLSRALSALSVRARTAFAVSCAYRIATTALRHGMDMRLAFDAIHQLRDFVEGKTLRDADAAESEIIASIEGEDEAPDFTASLVEDALAAAAYALRCAAGGDVMNAVWAARRAYEVADRYAGLRQNVTTFTDAAEDAILGHPAVQSEVRRQRRDLEDLQQMGGNPKGFAILIDRAGRDPLLD